ncbi:MAG: vWA domain-containing protein [Ginsengibacter sp.]
MKTTIYSLLSIFILSIAGCTKDNPGEKIADAASYYDGGLGLSPGGGGSGGSGDSTQNQAGVITAGEWPDLANWDFFTTVLKKEEYAKTPENWNFYPTHRISVKITGTNNLPQIDIPVLLKHNGQILYAARTDNKGMAELFPNLFTNDQSIKEKDLQLDIDNGNKIISDVKQFKDGVNTIVLPASQPSNNIDISFVIDATGSMGDELEYLKTELYDVLNNIKNSYPTYSVLTSAVMYRDEGDEYLTKSSPFDRTISTTLNFIKDQRADGGGDFPEAVHEGLNKAINNLEWSANARTRLLFLVLDAPPHANAEVVGKLQNLLKLASEKGIKIIPVTASGIDKDTEILMRLLSVATNGTYVFITNDSGVGDTHLEPTVGDYKVEFLNKLMIRLIKHYAE